MFSNIRSIAVDEVERIYVLDWREAHVKVFGGNGRYIKTIGKKGQGPVMPTIRAAINQNDQIVTGYPEKYEIKIFDKSGTLIRKIMKEYDPVEITEEEIEDATEGMPPDIKLSIPKCHNAYSWFITHDEGRIFSRHMSGHLMNVTYRTAIGHFEIFNSYPRSFEVVPP